MQPKPRLLVFDLDGTLIDSSYDLCASVNSALELVGRPPLPHLQIAGYIGDGAAMLVRRALALDGALGHGAAADEALFCRTFDLFLDIYRLHKLDTTRPYDGVLPALAEIRRNNPQLLMAVLTNKPVNPSREICAALGLAPFFFANYGGNSFATKKPAPDGLLSILSEASALLLRNEQHALPIAIAETVMIGDSGVDILTAQCCGACSLGCSYGLAPESLAAAHPDATAHHPSEWPALLGL